MTASESNAPQSPRERSLAEWALDLFVYVPAGVIATTLGDLDEMAEKGRVRVDQHVRNAHVVGHFAVDFGLRRMRAQAETLLTPLFREDAPEEPPRGAPANSTAAARRPATPDAMRARDPEVDRAIPDFDTLSASQVVRRLDGLEAHELRAVVRHELATRGRRTILRRAEQLLEGAAPDGAPPAAPAT